MTPETTFYNRLKRIFPKEWMLQRIETTTAVGVPDLNILVPKVGEFWMELKACDKYTLLRPQQYAWITKRITLGGIALVINQNKNKEIELWHEPFNVIKRADKSKYLTILDEPHKLYKKGDQKYLPIFLKNLLTGDHENESI
tara:strand:+ start:27 stop:452 length:426 start_codon:yes stop_codon:yes gene_type:complete